MRLYAVVRPHIKANGQIDFQYAIITYYLNLGAGMNLFHHFHRQIEIIINQLVDDGVLANETNCARVTVEPPRDPSHGDLTTNAAMVLAKPSGLKPRDLALKVSDKLLSAEFVKKTSIAGPGFINFTLDPSFWHQRLKDIILTGASYGDSNLGENEKVNIEYVSANPTGPLHVAHARGAVIGDALARLLIKAGYDVTTEYYINDAGAQVDILAQSTFLRYLEALGDEIETIPDGFYPGDYLKPIGKQIANRDGDQWKNKPEHEWLPVFREFAVSKLMDGVKQDLALLGIQQDVFTSEKSLVKSGMVDAVVETLDQKGLVYQGILEPPKGKTMDDWEPREQTLFKASDFGDDVDRPLKKSDGSYTYFTNDIANHLDKYRRGFKTMIDIFGADHGGYVKRMQAAVTAVTGGEGSLDIKLCQMVHLLKAGKPMVMSKRAGSFVTLNDLITDVGKDVVRFIMLTRKNDTQMEFDLEKALEQTRENPVFYVQYAHARCKSVLRNAGQDLTADDLSPQSLANAEVGLLADPLELELIKTMAAWPRAIEAAAMAHEPHRVAYYLNDVSTLFHSLWNKGKDNEKLRFILDDNKPLTLARLALIQSVATIIASGLDVFGVAPLDELR